ncbi:MAG: ABC transporter permease [Anaerolineae bacterium]|nr:ABC transporter permease [Anaerolineae bacterium]
MKETITVSPTANASSDSITRAIPLQAHRSLWRETFSRLLGHRLGLLSLVILGLLIITALLAPWIAPYDPYKMDFKARLQPPSREHWMGTDEAGRDLFSRILYGGRISLGVAAASVLLSLIIGLPWGIIAAYRGGWVDDALMRICDAVMAFPSLVFALIIIAALGASIGNLILTIGILSSPAYARIMRAAVLGERNKEYVTAAVATGTRSGRLMVRHIMPNCAAPLMVQISLGAASAILTEAALSFLGLGVQPPDASWATLLKQGYSFMSHNPWYVFFPGMMIFLAVWSLNGLGDGLRDALDPRLRSGR